MATREELYQALRNADAAGDTEGARKLAAYIQAMPGDAAPVDDIPKMLPRQRATALKDIPQGAMHPGDLLAGGLRGAASIGATFTTMPGAGYFDRRAETLSGVDQGLASLGADPESAAYRVGKVSGEIAGTAGAGGALGNAARVVGAPAPVVNALTSAGMRTGSAPVGVAQRSADMALRSGAGAVTGAAQTALVAPDQVGAGAGIGAVTPLALRVAGAAGSKVGSMFRPAQTNNALADLAVNQYGIPLGAADITSNPMTKAIRSVLNDAPITGAIGAKQREAVQGGFNAAVGGQFGAPVAKLTPQVMDQAKARMGAEFDRIWGGNILQVDNTFMQKVIDMQKAAGKLPANEGGSLSRELDDILNKIQQDQAGNLVIPGDVANKFQSYLRRRAEGSAGLRNELTDLRKTIIGAFNNSVSPADAAALTANRAQYKAFKTVEPLLNSAEAGVAGRASGDVPAGLLPGAVLKSYGNAAGTGMGDLSQIGSQFVADRVARTGGSARAMVQNSMLGGALGAGAFANPLLALGVAPVAAGTNWLLGSPSFAQLAMSRNGAVRNALAAPIYRTAPVLLGMDQ